MARLSEREADILVRVVVINVQVPLRLDSHVKQTVGRDLLRTRKPRR